MTSLYTETSVIGRLLSIFSTLFPSVTKPTRYLLTWFLIGQLALESAPSVRCLYRQFLSRQTDKALTSYYHALANEHVTDQSIRQALADKALQLISPALRNEPIFLSIDDTTIAKAGKHFDGVSILYDHARHNGRAYVNGHCFVSITMSVPILKQRKGKPWIDYLAVPLGYAMWDKTASKLQLAADLLDEVMPMLSKRQVILLFDSWYAKKNLIQHARQYDNLAIICNVRHDTQIYELPAAKTGPGRPRKYGRRLTLDDLYENIWKKTYQTDQLLVTHKVVKAKIFGDCQVHAYVTLSKSGSRRLFLSTVKPMALHMSVAWQNSKMLRDAGSKEMEFYPLRLYKLRWGIETNYYEQKMFWQLSHYMVRKQTSIEHLMNLTNAGHAVMKMLPYLDDTFRSHQDDSPQELRHFLSWQIQREIIFATLVQKAQNSKNPDALLKALQDVIRSDEEAA